MRISFLARIWRIGKSYVATIPKEYIKSNHLQEKQTYNFIVEVEHESSNNNIPINRDNEKA
jgi:hypothetical protein